MTIETAIATTEFLDDMKIHNAKIPNFKMNDDNEVCVYIDGDYYKVCSEAMYINGTGVKKSDTVEIDGKYYPKENSEYLKNNEYGEKRINLGLKLEFENPDLFET